MDGYTVRKSHSPYLPPYPVSVTLCSSARYPRCDVWFFSVPHLYVCILYWWLSSSELLFYCCDCCYGTWQGLWPKECQITSSGTFPDTLPVPVTPSGRIIPTVCLTVSSFLGNLRFRYRARSRLTTFTHTGPQSLTKLNHTPAKGICTQTSQFLSTGIRLCF